MFFVLSKAAAPLLVPSNLLVLVGVAGLFLFPTRWRRLGRRMALLSLTLFLLLGILPVGSGLTYVLENRFPAWDASRGPPDGIVILGGAINPAITRVRGQVALSDAAERVTIIPKLARDYPNARLIFSGGDSSLFADEPREADYLYPLLDNFGVPRERVALERNSRNTAENATFSKALANPRPGERWLVVTSAAHMPRAIGCFRRAGFDVEAFPVDWHTSPRWRFEITTSPLYGIATLDTAVREWEGLFFYWLSGRTSALFPQP